MGIIDEKEDMHEAAHDYYREEESRLEAEQEEREIEMLTEADGWAYDPPWIPASIRPVKDGEYLTVRNVEDKSRITPNIYRRGEWLFNGIWKVTAWLPIPEANE